jgi:hypothetical protein
MFLDVLSQKTEDSTSIVGTSKFRFYRFAICVFLAFSVLSFSCSKVTSTQNDCYCAGDKPYITLTTSTDVFSSSIHASGAICIDWGNSIKSHKVSPWDDYPQIELNYRFSEVKPFNIRITGEVTQFFIWGGGITDLVISNNQLLTWIHGSDQKLSKIDLSQNHNLTNIAFENNYLEEIDITNNHKLVGIMLNSNPISTIDLSKNNNLIVFQGSNTLLDSLDITNNHLLTAITIEDNNFTKSELNKLMHSLPNQYTINHPVLYIGGNPGYQESDKSIAEAKGWFVSDYL